MVVFDGRQSRSLAEIQETVRALWPKDVSDNPALALQMAQVSVMYGLDPLMKEITIYRGALYVTYLGHLRVAMNHPQYRGFIAEPATAEDRRALMVRDGIHAWRAEVYRADWPRPVIGWGFVDVATDANVVAKVNPQLIARKRALDHAWRDAFGFPLPTAPFAAERDDPGIAVTDDETPGPGGWVEASVQELPAERVAPQPLSKGQNAAIHAICKELGIGEVARHNLLATLFSKESTGELTEAEAASFLNYLAIQAERRSLQSPPSEAGPTRVPSEGVSGASAPSEAPSEPEEAPEPEEGYQGRPGFTQLLAELPAELAATYGTMREEIARLAGQIKVPWDEGIRRKALSTTLGTLESAAPEGISPQATSALLMALVCASTGVVSSPEAAAADMPDAAVLWLSRQKKPEQQTVLVDLGEYLAENID